MNYNPINLPNSKWMLFESILNDKRKRNYSLRDIFNAIFICLKKGTNDICSQSVFPNEELGLLLFYQLGEHWYYRTNT
jgi:hypothetical protein